MFSISTYRVIFNFSRRFSNPPKPPIHLPKWPLVKVRLHPLHPLQSLESGTSSVWWRKQTRRSGNADIAPNRTSSTGGQPAEWGTTSGPNTLASLPNLLGQVPSPKDRGNKKWRRLNKQSRRLRCRTTAHPKRKGCAGNWPNPRKERAIPLTVIGNMHQVININLLLTSRPLSALLQGVLLPLFNCR